MPLIKANEIIKTYRFGETSVEALKNVSLEIEPGSFVAFVGPSGSGKTTLLNLIGCLDKPSRGNLAVAGTDTTALGRQEAARFRGRNIGFIFQDFNLIPVLTAAENVEYPLIMVKNTDRQKRRSLVAELLEAVGLDGQANKRPDQLSGGQKQRVAVARALVTQPKVVLADEPTANLDHQTAQTILSLMKSMRDKFGTTFVFSTHDPRIVDQAERIFKLSDGRLLNGDHA